MIPIFDLRAALLGSFAVALFAQPSAADDAGLYDKPIDPHSAFVRVISPGSSIASVLNNSFDGLEDGVSPYVAVQPGNINVSSRLSQTNVSADAGKFYTAILTKDGVSTFQDDVTKNPARASLAFYNLSDHKDVSLFVPQAKAEAISSVPSGESKTVALRAPLTVDFVVRADGKDIASLSAVELKRDGGVTIVLTGSGDAVSAVAVQSKIARQQ